jgi:hypothetical protein
MTSAAMKNAAAALLNHAIIADAPASAPRIGFREAIA